MAFNLGTEFEMHGLVYSYNEKAFEKGLPQLGYRHWCISSDNLRKESLEYVRMLANLNTDVITDHDCKLMAKCISEMAVHFLSDKYEQYREYNRWYLEDIHNQFTKNFGNDWCKSYEAAYELAIHDNGVMQSNLADCYMEGRGTEQNLARALFWYDTSMISQRKAESIRQQLEDEGKPCRVDGILYGPKLLTKHQNLEWWKQYYKEKGLILKNYI